MAFFEGSKMTAGYGDGPDIISSCTINVDKGEIVAILGPNGAGKSTAMKTMLGLLNLKSGGSSIAVPGVYDMISAKLAERAGFPALYVSGYGISAAHLGLPDVGLMTFSDMFERVQVIARNSTVPVIADADTGYGSLINLRHTVQSYEIAGVSAIQIEDQEFPKRCAHAAGVRVIEKQEMMRKMAREAAGHLGRAALDAAKRAVRRSAVVEWVIWVGCASSCVRRVRACARSSGRGRAPRSNES